MLDTDFVRGKLAARGGAYPLDELIVADTDWKNTIIRSEELRRRRNEESEAIGKLKREGHDTSQQQIKVKEISAEIKALEEKVRLAEERLNSLLHTIPNLPDDSVPVGSDETANLEVRRWGNAPKFDFTPLDHVDIGTSLGILDMERAAKIAGARFSLLHKTGALMERALINFMLDIHTRHHGYQEVVPPFMANSTSLFGTGNLPKFAQDLFKVEGTDFYLIPTAEVPVTNIFSNEILDFSELPKNQFNKVELVKFVEPSTSYDELEALTRDAEEILQRLGLHYRVVMLCTGDMGFSSAKTYDLEVWLPSQNRFREVSSCSNFEAFQARRANIRFRAEDGKRHYLHTLNGSGLAIGRTWLAILENYQQRDGSVAVPEALQPYMGGMKVISK